MARDIYFNKARVNWYNEWHRQIQNDHWRMIDIDSYEYCNECRNGIAIIETTYDVGKYNKVAYLLNLFNQYIENILNKLIDLENKRTSILKQLELLLYIFYKDLHIYHHL